VSIYIPNIGNGHEADEQELQSRLQKVQEAITGERDNNPGLEVFIAGDFNRHDTIWGGNDVALEPRRGEGSRILEFIEEELATPHPERSSNVGTERISVNNRSNHG
jgi:hypothetical protein